MNNENNTHNDMLVALAKDDAIKAAEHLMNKLQTLSEYSAKHTCSVLSQKVRSILPTLKQIK